MKIRAHRDPSLSAEVISRRSLLYTDGADAGLDRPAHVRAGSALLRIGQKLLVVQDDTSFIAIADGADVRGVPLPAGPGGRRQFGEGLGNKKDKLDLEACVLHEGTLVAFGSGSTAARERVVVVSGIDGPSPSSRVIDAPVLYRGLRTEPAFAGSELNVEGAARQGAALVLFQRGNGALRGGQMPVNATCELPFAEVWSHLLDGSLCPHPRNIVQYDLGEVSGVPLTFTDATAAPSGALLFLAAAEDSPDAYDDGPVTGVALGILEAGSARLVLIRDESGAPLRAKAEGLCLRPGDLSRADVVIDRDDPGAPCELFEIALGGFFDARR